MKILFITDLYPIQQGENLTPQTLHNFVIDWIRQGSEVDVIKPNFVFNSFLRKKPFYPDGFYNYNGVRIFNVNYFTPFCFDFLKKIPKEIDLAKYDVVVAHMPSGIIFANKLAKIINKPLVCGVHVSDIEVLTNPIYKFYFKPQLLKAYRNAKKIACRSFVLQRKFNKLFPELAEKTFVAVSGVELPTKSPNRQPSSLLNSLSLSSETSKIKVLTCANLIKRKNIDKLISAINNLDGFELKVVGDGEEFEKLKKMAGGNVEFLGRLPHEKVSEEMAKADIFILPSVNETFGMVYLEAMAAGCVTVCSENDGVDGIIIDSVNGFLSEPTVNGIKSTLLRIKNFKDIDLVLDNSLASIRELSPENCATSYLVQL